MIEGEVANAILDKRIEVSIGGEKFKVSPPRNATIIKLSEYASMLPQFDENVFKSIIEKGYKTASLFDIVAILVCGQIRPLQVFSVRSHIKYWRWRRKLRRVRMRAKYDASPSDLENALTKILPHQQLGVFFSLITSLKEANVLKPTR